MKLFIKNISIFIILTMTAYYSLSYLNKFSPPFWGNKVLTNKLKYINKTSSEYSTYFLGTSKTFRQVIPSLFDSLTLEKSFNLGSPATVNPELFELTRYLIKKVSSSKRKTFFIELHNASPSSYTPTSRNIYWHNPSNFIHGIKFWVENKSLHSITAYNINFIKNTFKIGLIQDQIHSINSPIDYSYGYKSQGYVSLENELGLKEAELYKNRNELFLKDTIGINDRWGLPARKKKILKEYSSKNQSYNKFLLHEILELIEVGKQNNIHIIFVKPSRLLGTVTIFNKIPSKNKIDLCDPNKFPELYLANYSFDKAHLNNKGAEINTIYLAEKFLKLKKSTFN